MERAAGAVSVQRWNAVQTAAQVVLGDTGRRLKTSHTRHATVNISYYFPFPPLFGVYRVVSVAFVVLRFALTNYGVE